MSYKRLKISLKILLKRYGITLEQLQYNLIENIE